MKLCFLLLAVVLWLAPHAYGYTPPPGYIEMSAAAKREWHAHQAVQSRRLRNRSVVEEVCGQMVAAAPSVFAGFIRQSVEGPSGYADPRKGIWQAWRWLFGKAIHRAGVTAPGEVEFLEPTLGMPAGRYPVTYRFSRATAHVEGISFFNFRPGMLVSFHRDGLDDINLFLMPPNGLDGFPKQINVLDPEIRYTHWLNLPSPGVQKLARNTFELVVADPYHQFIGEGPIDLNADADVTSLLAGSQLEWIPQSWWTEQYERSRDKKDFRDRFAALPVSTGRELFTIAQKGTNQVRGRAFVFDRWRTSRHGDRYWFATHTSFLPK